MKLVILLLLQLGSGSPISTIPEKLRLYQNITGIDDFEINKIFKKSLEGKWKDF